MALSEAPESEDAVSVRECVHTRVFYFFWVSGLMALAHLIIYLGTAWQSGAMLCVGVSLAGIAFGHCYPLLVICTGDLFGRVNLGANYMLYDGYASVFSSFVFGKFLPEAPHLPI